MNHETASGHWNQIAGAVREKYGQVTDHDIASVNGNLQQLIGMLQHKTGESREYIERFVHSVGEKGSQVFNRIYGQSGEYATHAAEALKGSYDQVSRQVADSVEQAKDAVQRRPMEAVLTAFGVGVLAGLVAAVTLGSNNRR